MYQISVKRIEQDLYDLSRFGYNENDQGVYRQGFSEADMQARHWLMEKMQQEGMTARLDGAANVIGRYENDTNRDKPAVMIGSHLDSVPAGGIFDGTLGVMAGLECVRVIRENAIDLSHPIEVVATSEEEGRFGGMLGSQAISGGITPDWLETAYDPSGETLKDAMARWDMDIHDVLHAYRHPDELKAFLELHIEQGPVLEARQIPIGVVDCISGVFKWVIHLRGKASHAGTAPMDMRSDAFMGAADFAHEIPRIIEEDGTDRSRLTIGRIELKPGFPHTIPGEAEFTIVGRDTCAEVMTNLANSCRRVLSAIARRHGLMFEYEEMSWLDPKSCDPDMVGLLKSKAEARGYKYLQMPSGAGHDTQFMTDITKAGLIFVPSVGGISHAPDEMTHWVDIEKGANLLLDAVLELAA
tara:strand:+ start:13250 stop:14488 length:1239 start_codon:yes stop_codon:yes gene_type:complete